MAIAGKSDKILGLRATSFTFLKITVTKLRIEQLMLEQVQYITNEQGERVGVLLNIEVYQRLVNPLTADSECLTGLNKDELQALANSKLAPSFQAALNHLLTQNAESELSANELAELEDLLAEIDQLTLLKTRARYTLTRLQELAAVL
jgi:hypothetical protein